MDRALLWVGVIVMCGCSKPADTDKAKDPWATTTKSDPAPPDPWAATNTGADPASATTPTPTAPAPSGEPSSFTGLFRCETFTFIVGGPSTYLPSKVGKIVIDSDGTYHAESYDNGTGQTHVRDNMLTFDGGPLDGWVSAIRPSALGRYFIVNSRDPKTPVQAVHLGDSACYPRKK